MEDLVEKLREAFEAARDTPGFLEFSLLGLAAMLEYVFPPFPGDVVTLLGAFMVGAFEWSLPGVWLAVTAGSVAGLSLDYAFGAWVQRHDPIWRKKYPRWARLGRSIDRFDAFYRRWGAWCILANRFLPAVRAIFFVAAGMAGIRYWKVLVLGLVSSAAWNLLIFLVGVSVGHKWEDLLGFLRTYSTVAWIAVAVAAVVLVVVFLVRRRRGRAGL